MVEEGFGWLEGIRKTEADLVAPAFAEEVDTHQLEHTGSQGLQQLWEAHTG